jgi:hypothetical protein
MQAEANGRQRTARPTKFDELLEDHIIPKLFNESCHFSGAFAEPDDSRHRSAVARAATMREVP